MTTHRRENQGDAMRGVGRALARIADAEPDMVIVLPAHKNPVVREAVLPALEGKPNVIVTEPLAYGEFTRMLSLAHIVLTDSGGVQEEAPSLGKPVLVMRDNTERPEAVDAGTVTLIGTDEERIVKEVDRLLHDQDHFDSMANAVNPYGDGWQRPERSPRWRSCLAWTAVLPAVRRSPAERPGRPHLIYAPSQRLRLWRRPRSRR